jgi:predicted metalloprotease with PDZ domain
VAGPHPLPFGEIFNIVGITYSPQLETKDSLFSTGGITLRFNQTTGRIRVADISKMNSVGKQLGYRLNDEIVSINGETITSANVNSFLRNFGKTSKVGDELVVKVIRKDQTGADTNVELKATMTKFPVIRSNALEFKNDATPQQLLIRNAWLKPNDMQKN